MVVSIPAETVRTTANNVRLSIASRKNKTPSSAVATNSRFSQMETDEALAARKPSISSNGPKKPPKNTMPNVFQILSTPNNLRSWLGLPSTNGSMVTPAPRYNKPASWNEFSPPCSILLNGVATPNSNPASKPATMEWRFIFNQYAFKRKASKKP